MSIFNNIEAKIKADRDKIKFCVFQEKISLNRRKEIMQEIIKDKIEKTYDPNLTDLENAEKAGVCFNTFKKWAIENKKTKSDRQHEQIEFIKKNYDHSLSINKNFELPEMQTLNVSLSTFKRLVKKTKIEKQSIDLPEPQIIELPEQVTTEKVDVPQNEPKQRLCPKNAAMPTGIKLKMPDITFNFNIALEIKDDNVKIFAL